jgi:hypothetical protein
MDHWIAQDAEYLAVWVRMLSEANFEPQTKMFNGQVITVGRGQLIFGLDSYSEKTKVSVMRLRRLVDLLENHQMINRVKFSKYSLISIVNYDKHQADNKQTTITEQADNNTIRIKEDNKRNNIVDSGESPDMVGKKKKPKPSAFDDLKVTYQERAFNVFWSEVERKKVGKADALKAFVELTKDCNEEKTDFALNVICHWYELYLQEDESRLLPENKKYLKGAGAWMREKPWQADKAALAKFKKEYYGEPDESQSTN